MSGITTHVLDAVIGKPACGVQIRLEKEEGSAWILARESATGADGRCCDLADNPEPGVYRMTFATGSYLARMGRTGIYPEISIAFVCASEEHYHLPLLLSDNSYTTYRGS